MGLPSKAALLDAAEVADAWRVVPRLIIGGYAYIVWDTSMWFKGLEVPTDPQQWFINGIWLAAGGITKWYFDSGRKWA